MKYALFLFFLFGISSAFSQGKKDKSKDIKGVTCLSVGYGYFNMNLDEIANRRDAFPSPQIIGPLFGKYEYREGHAGLGVAFAYYYASALQGLSVLDTITGDYKTTYHRTPIINSYSVLFRYNIHIGHSEKFDPYIGFGFGYRGGFQYRSIGWWTHMGKPSPLGGEGTLGVRYFVNDDIAIYAEAGGSKAALQGGLVYRIKSDKQ